MMHATAELITGFCWILFTIFIAISFPYAKQELQKDWTRLRGQFGIAICFISAGMLGRLLINYAYMRIAPAPVTAYWRMVEPIGVALTLLISAGNLIAIRAVTFETSGEKVWLRSACAAAALSIVLWVVF
jgi:hypothetical protein